MPRIDLSKIDWLAPDKSTAVEHTVRGTVQKFYPLSPLVLPEFQETFKKLAAGAREFMHNTQHEGGTQIVEDQRQGHVRTETTSVPLSVELSKDQARRRRETVEEMVAAVMDSKSMYAIGRCILDSMRDTFPREAGKPFTEADGKELVEQLDIPDFVAMAMGVMKANLDSFGALGKKFARRAQEKVENLLEEETETPGETSEVSF